MTELLMKRTSAIEHTKRIGGDIFVYFILIFSIVTLTQVNLELKFCGRCLSANEFVNDLCMTNLEYYS